MGRPEVYTIDPATVTRLRLQGQSWTQIVRYLGIVRVETLREWRLRTGFEDPGERVKTEEGLKRVEELVADFMECHEERGARVVMGHLWENECFPTRETLRDVIVRLAPEGLKTRAFEANKRISRCVYHVEGPHHLWHLDGHHKLIRWGLITHGCID